MTRNSYFRMITPFIRTHTWYSGNMRNRTCEHCQTPINLLRDGARFCNPKCRAAAHRATQKTNQIPAQLRETGRWVRWRHETRMARVTKAPRTADGTGYASVSDTSTWTTYKTAKSSEHGDGLGFVLNGDGIACIDLDSCVVDGQPTKAAQRVLDAFPAAWVEVSPSGNGLHVWGTAEPARGRVLTLTGGLQAEFYSQARYLTVTGRTFRPGDLSQTLSVERLQQL